MTLIHATFSLSFAGTLFLNFYVKTATPYRPRNQAFKSRGEYAISKVTIDIYTVCMNITQSQSNLLSKYTVAEHFLLRLG